MKELRPIIWILLRFVVCYLVLTLAYSMYLSDYIEKLSIADPFTQWVAKSVEQMMVFLGFKAESVQVANEPFCRFYLEGTYTSFINEGCNAVAVMIIFVSFVVAFFQRFVPTVLFILVGLILLHLANLFRVGWLNYIYLENPDFARTAHDIVFPAVIYGMVVLLWLIWVKFFVFKSSK